MIEVEITNWNANAHKMKALRESTNREREHMHCTLCFARWSLRTSCKITEYWNASRRDKKTLFIVITIQFGQRWCTFITSHTFTSKKWNHIAAASRHSRQMWTITPVNARLIDWEWIKASFWPEQWESKRISSSRKPSNTVRLEFESSALVTFTPVH